MNLRPRWRLFSCRLLSCVLCAALVLAPVSSAAAEDAGKSDEEGWSLLESSLEEAEENAGDAGYSGYIVKIRSGAERSAALLEETEDGIEEISGEKGLYEAEDLEAVRRFAPPEDIEYIEPNYLFHLCDSELRATEKTTVSGNENDKHLELMTADSVREDYRYADDAD